VKYLRTLALCLASIALCAGSDLADSLYKAAEKAERSGDLLHAYLLYSRASALEPANVAYAAKKTLLRAIATQSMRAELGPDPAASKFAPKAETLSARDILDARDKKYLAPPQLAPSQEKKTFNLKGDARAIFEQVAAAYEFQVVFEADYQSPPPFTFRMDDAAADDALRGLETVANSFLVPVNSKLALVARDTPAKRTERMPDMAVAIPIPERMTAQDAQELLTAVQQTLDIRRAVLDPGKHQVFVRAEAGKVAAAQQLLASLSKLRTQVAVDVEFLSVAKTSTLNYGMTLPFPISLVNFQGTQTLAQAFGTLRSFASYATPYAIGITQSSIFATIARASADTLLEGQIVALDGQAATLHVGQHYPIASNQYVGNTSGQTGTVYTPPPTITFEDLGLVLKITPSVHRDNEVTLDVDAEFKTLGATSPVSGIPIIASNKYTAKVRLADGEWAVIAGLVQTNDSDTKVGVPGLMDVPWIGRFFTQNTVEKDRSDILVVLKPHVTSLPPWENLTQTIWIGTDTRPLTLFQDGK
jgi:general secretion pathway protein D